MTRDIIDINEMTKGNNSNLPIDDSLSTGNSGDKIDGKTVEKNGDKSGEKKEQKVTLSPEAIENLTATIIENLKSVYDPEIPVDIYELGLIYKVDLESDHHVKVTMTLTAPGCPVAGEMPIWVHDAIKKIDGIERVEVELVFDPAWTTDLMSDEAKLDLGWL